MKSTVSFDYDYGFNFHSFTCIRTFLLQYLFEEIWQFLIFLSKTFYRCSMGLRFTDCVGVSDNYI